MKIDSTNRYIQPLSDENLPETNKSALPDRDVIESAAAGENLFTKLIGSASHSAPQSTLEHAQDNRTEAAPKAAEARAGEKVFGDIAEEVVTDVAIAEGLTVAAFTVGGAAFGFVPALGITAFLDSSDLQQALGAIADSTGAVVDAFSNAADGVADAISDVFDW